MKLFRAHRLRQCALKMEKKIISLMCHFFPKMNFSAPKLEQSEPCQQPIFKHFVSHTPQINGYPETKTICYSFFLSVKKILVYLKKVLASNVCLDINLQNSAMLGILNLSTNLVQIWGLKPLPNIIRTF